MYDYHTHTSYSDDCDVPMKEMIEKAIEKGLTELAITDHCDPGYPDPAFPFLLDFDRYHNALLEAEKIYKDKIKIIKGLEIGIMEGQHDFCNQTVNEFPYDFIIGSFHCIGSSDLHTYDFTNTDISAFLEDFYVYVYQCLKEYKNYDVLGHLTIVDRYIKKIYDYKPYMDVIEEILKMIIYDGKGLEINTSSFKYKSNAWLPREEVLKLYCDLGGEILTFGSDSHHPDFFLDHFEEAYDLAQKIGFRYFTTYEKRRTHFHRLSL